MFGHHLIDKTVDEHLCEIAELAKDPQTLIFLDTNILAYLYKLHEAARSEFFAWSDSVKSVGRLNVPAWAASEYLVRVTSKTLEAYTPKGKEPTQTIRALDSLHQTASLFVDDALLDRAGLAPDRMAYVSEFRAVIDALKTYLRVFSQQFDPGVIHQQIQTHLSSAVLDSDLVALCAKAGKEGEARYKHRMPPGFCDGHKEENAFGDLIIWYEILEKSASVAAEYPKVLFITNDEKSDWVYAPKMRYQLVGTSRRAVGNSKPEIKVADPRLLSEFRRKTGHSNVTICSLATLVEGLSRTNATHFAHLAAAIQINTQESNFEVSGSDSHASALDISTPVTEHVQLSEDDAALERMQESSRVDAVEPEASPHLHYSQEALQDSLYQVDAPSEINRIIRALKSLNWYTQNPAIEQILNIREDEFTPSSWFVLGRNIYQAACGNSQKAMEFMSGLEAKLGLFPESTAQHILAGMLFEIYFNSNGELRSEFKFDYANKPLSVAVQPGFENALAFIISKLRPHRHMLIILPGDQECKIVRVISEAIEQTNESQSLGVINYLRSVTLDGIELMRATEPQVDAHALWGGRFYPAEYDIKTIREKISTELAIPEWALAVELEPPINVRTTFSVEDGYELFPKQVLQSDT